MMYKQREIVLVPFPFSDLTEIKRRPVLIISNNKFNSSNEDIIVCSITSTAYIDLHSIPIDNLSLEYGILPEPSVIKTHKIFTISKSRIIKKFSILNPDTFSLVISSISTLISMK